MDDTSVFELSRAALDELPFGVVTLDRSGTILRFNREQETLARRRSMRTVGLSFFNDVAPCTNVQDFRGRFDAFAQGRDSGVERFSFSFAFRWGRQDVTITMLRKAGHDDINILIRGRAVAQFVETGGTGVHQPLERPSDMQKMRPFVDAKELPRPAVFPLDPTDEAALRERVHPDDLVTVRAVIDAAARDRTGYAVEYRGPSIGDSRRILLEHGFFDRDPAGACYATILDVTEQRRLEAQTWRSAHYDSLTGLPNQQLLLLRIADAVREAETAGRVAAVVVADIDRFRDVNDTFGHDAGNAVLRAVALRLGECVRSGDTVARIGADSFVVLLTDLETSEQAGETAIRLIAAIGHPLVIDGHPHFLALRVGISLAPFDSRDPIRVLHAAEAANFAAKNGSAGIRFYSNQLALDAASHLERQNELRRALENNEFELLYQPLVDIDCDRVVAAEALVRWNHPTRGLVSPIEFIPLADHTGLIVPLGEWVLRTACRQARAWAEKGLDIRVCVNVSTIQFQRPNFVELVASILAETGIDPHRLELELTESIMVDGFGEMMDTLTRLKTLGLRLAIDDFGTGYSSLSYLKYFPVDTLKIDRAFITDIASDEFDHAIATAIFTLTRNLGLECVVEGVENVEQLEVLRDIGCNVVQGYYFCKPSRPETLTGSLVALLASARPYRLLNT